MRFNFEPTEYKFLDGRVVVETSDFGCKYDMVIQSVGFEVHSGLECSRHPQLVTKVGWCSHGARGTISSNIKLAEAAVEAALKTGSLSKWSK